jgi:hypothetical protein
MRQFSIAATAAILLTAAPHLRAADGPYIAAGYAVTGFETLCRGDACDRHDGGFRAAAGWGFASSNARGFIGFRSVSEHGRYVAYMHEGDDPTNFYILAVLVRDTCVGAPAGCVPSTSKASADPDGLNPIAHGSYLFPSISADGHYVAFVSELALGGGAQVYLALTGY